MSQPEREKQKREVPENEVPEREISFQFLKNPLPVPKKRSHVIMDYDIKDLDDFDDFDLEISDNDDFDI